MGDRADLIFDIVFFVVLLSALAQGMTLKFSARKLGLLYEAIEDPNFPIDMEVLEKTKNGIKEFSVNKDDYSIDKRIVDLNLPQGCLVLFIKRDNAFVIPDGSTRFQEKDRVLIVTMSKTDIDTALLCFQEDMIKGKSFFMVDGSDQVH